MGHSCHLSLLGHINFGQLWMTQVVVVALLAGRIVCMIGTPFRYSRHTERLAIGNRAIRMVFVGNHTKDVYV